MARWIKTVDIKDLLTDDDSPENAVKVGLAMAERLRSRLAGYLDDDPDFEEIVNDFEAVGDAQQFALSAFNDTMNRLYDWADGERIWLGI